MKNMTRWLAVSFCTATLGAGLAFADHNSAANRQKRQQKRISEGAGSGELTKKEAWKLEKNAAKIHRSVVKDRHDGGKFTAKERIKAQKKLNKQNRAIARQKHDKQTQ